MRSVTELKNKFAELKTRTKQKANALFREAKKTGAEFATNDENESSILCELTGPQIPPIEPAKQDTKTEN
ncbi:hypothetical protein TcasGA2_TC004053 [Tribolium castaneum]|uniref:Uncharacterized protein n=1 Tax=Tribolium castaneum TaxID=7070 RepID=D7EIH5_TRICA|nr:hypothetical protein TcasGA2_TC004053 [Tribolium castaneum]